MADINGTMMQYFHWYISDEGNHWKQLKEQAAELAAAGFTALWLPPAYKGSGGIHDVGYSIYDLFDLGEFDQKGSIRTKYGTRQELLEAIQAAQARGIQVYADVVFNHKNGGDETEDVEAIPVASDNRNHVIGEAELIKVWTHFTFPGRGDRHSSMKWHWWHFDSVNHNMNKPNQDTIYRFKEKQFDAEVDPRHGNYDFLMACDLDTDHPEVKEELRQWGKWMLDTTGIDGYRFDAVKHVHASFFHEWLTYMRQYAEKNLFAVGEYWSETTEALHWFIDQTKGLVSLFDVPLHYNFHRASRAGGYFDMRQILNGTLVQQQPTLAVTFVDNHDSQPLQSLESPVESWFKPLAYAIILLRREGYPCVFYGDYYGAQYTDKGRDGNTYTIELDSYRWLLDKLLYARRQYAHGHQYDYFDHWDVVGWTRLGNAQYPGAMAVIMSDGLGGSKWMEVGKPNTIFRDLTEHLAEKVCTNEYGWGEFLCKGGSVSVWVEDDCAL
jgi:alpha-amylase